MTHIKKITDKQGNDIYLRTHTKAVVDGNGYTAESRLQAMQDEINQAQLAVGAIPSDLTPTENSTNWVTSGGVFNAVCSKKEYFDILSSSTHTNDTNFITIEKEETGFQITCIKAGAYKYAWCSIPNLVVGETYNVHFDFTLTNTSSATYPYLLTIETAEENGNRLAGVMLQKEIGMTGTVDWKITPTTSTTTFKVANNNIGIAGGTMEIYNLSVNQNFSLKESVDINTSKINVIEDVVNDITFVGSDIVTAGQTDDSIITCQIENGTIKIIATGPRTSEKYAYFMLPSNLEIGKKYIMMFDYEANVNYNDGALCLSAGTTNQYPLSSGYRFRTGKGRVEFPFTNNSYVCMRIASNALNGVGDYIYITNFSIYSQLEKYDSLPIISNKLNNLLDKSVSNASEIGNYIGSPIPKINQYHQIGYKKLMNNVASQGGAAYGKYYFQFTDRHASMNVYDLETNTLHSTVSMTSTSTDHCTNASFSSIFYTVSDDFPLIYTSGSSIGTYNHIQVWRIQLSDDIFTIEKIQEIVLPTGTEDNIWHWGQAFLDNELNYLYYLTYDSSAKNANYIKFRIPSIFDESNNIISNVELTENNIIDSFITEKNQYPQGCVCKNGILYLFEGIPASGVNTKITIVNVWGKCLVNSIDICKTLGITYEFEGCGIYNDTLIANTNGNGIYAIYF